MSFAGGIDGNEVTLKMISAAEVKTISKLINYAFQKILKSKGILYLLLIEENEPDKIVMKMKENFFYEVNIINSLIFDKNIKKFKLLVQKRYQNEMQYIFKFIKK